MGLVDLLSVSVVVVGTFYYRAISDILFFFFFKQKTAYEIVSRDWSSDVCSSDLCPFLVGSAPAFYIDPQRHEFFAAQITLQQRPGFLDRKSVV